MHEAACVHGRGFAVRFVKLAHEMRCGASWRRCPSVLRSHTIRTRKGSTRAVQRYMHVRCPCFAVHATQLPRTKRSWRARRHRPCERLTV